MKQMKFLRSRNFKERVPRSGSVDPISLGLMLLSFLFYTDLLAAVGLWFRVGPAGWEPLAGAAAAILTGLWFSGNFKRGVWSAAWFVAYVAVAAFLSSFIYDPSFDTYLYHSDTVVLLSEGWNPLDGMSPTGSLWVTYYPRAAELFQAAMLSLTGNLQATKCVGPILLLSAALLLWGALRRIRCQKIGKRQCLACVLVAVCNPLVLGQFMSMYVDYILWLTMLLLIAGFMLCLDRPKEWIGYAVIFFVMAFGLNVKITHFFYLGLTALLLAAFCVWEKLWRLLGRCSLAVMAGVVIGVCVIGYNPLLTNIFDHGCPYYPLNLPTVDIMSANTPEMFSGGNAFENFFKSLLSTPGHPWGIARCELEPGELAATYSRVANVNGFGFLMAPMLLTGLGLMVTLRGGWRWWVAYASVFIFCLLFDQGWWARYIPFLWMAVALPVTLSYYYPGKGSRLLRRFLLVFVAVSSLLWIMSGCFTFARYTVFMDYVIERRHRAGRPLEVVGLTPTSRQQLRERGVEYIEKDAADVEGKEYYRFFGTDYFPTGIRLPADLYPEAAAKQPEGLLRIADFESRRFDPAAD